MVHQGLALGGIAQLLAVARPIHSADLGGSRPMARHWHLRALLAMALHLRNASLGHCARRHNLLLAMHPLHVLRVAHDEAMGLDERAKVRVGVLSQASVVGLVHLHLCRRYFRRLVHDGLSLRLHVDLVDHLRRLLEEAHLLPRLSGW